MTDYPTTEKTIRGVEILRTPFRNFSGSPTKFNPKGGDRFFNIRLTEEQHRDFEKEGWRVRELPPREEGAEPLYFMQVKVKYGGIRPPRIVKVTPAGKQPLTEEVVGNLDSADIEYADLIIRPYSYEGQQPTAYLQTMFVHIKLNELEMEYEMESEDAVECDDEGICYINGVRIN